jgi:hypothetical protein
MSDTPRVLEPMTWERLAAGDAHPCPPGNCDCPTDPRPLFKGPVFDDLVATHNAEQRRPQRRGFWSRKRKETN